MEPEGTVAPHKIVHVNNIPRTKSVFSQPLNQGLKLVSRLQMLRSNHLILHYDYVLKGVQLSRHWELRNHQPQRSLDENKHPKHHPLVALVNGLVGFRVDELLVILCEIVGGEGYQSEFLVLSILVVLRHRLILTPVHRQSSEHDCIDYLAALSHFFDKILFFTQLEFVAFLPCLLERIQYFFLEPCLPVLVHELRVAVDN